MVNKPLIYVWDLEVKAAQTYKGDLRAAPGYTIVFGWKELGKGKAQSISTIDYPGVNVLDDSKLVAEIRKILEPADMLIHHFGDRFDWPFIQTRLARWGMEPLQKPPTFDTCTVARKNLSIKSNSLKSLAYFYGFKETKMELPEDVWLLANAGDKASIELLSERCRSDVRLTEKLYYKMLPSADKHPAVYHLKRLTQATADVSLPKQCQGCGLKEFRFKGYAANLTVAYKRFMCKSCGLNVKVLVPKKLHKDL